MWQAFDKYVIRQIVGQTSRVDRSLQRWEQFSETMPRDARWNAARAAWGALPEAGWNGFGAGTFAIVFPYYTAGWGEALRGRWIYLHEDYLQTLMEWGWLGGGLLGWVFLGGMGTAVWNLARAKGKRGGELRNADGGMRTGEGKELRNADGGMRTAEGKELRNADGGMRSEKGKELRNAEGGMRSEKGKELRNAEGGMRMMERGEVRNAEGGSRTGEWAPRQRLFAPLVLLGLGAVALHALVDFPLQVASIQIYVATYVGVCWGTSGFAGRVNG